MLREWGHSSGNDVKFKQQSPVRSRSRHAVQAKSKVLGIIEMSFSKHDAKQRLQVTQDAEDLCDCECAYAAREASRRRVS